MKVPIPENTCNRILSVRGRRVILDSDLAELYGAPTKRLNEQVSRNRERFPPDFAFTLSSEEWENLKSQIATSSWGGRRKLPYVFTEHGALMAAGVLNSSRAIEVSIYVVRAFVAMREAIANTHELSKRLDELEKGLERRLVQHDHAIAEILAAIRALMRPPEHKGRPIGFFRPKED
jgi:ATP-dependent Clp protease ATP-binding subunit ClpA